MWLLKKTIALSLIDIISVGFLCGSTGLGAVFSGKIERQVAKAKKHVPQGPLSPDPL